MSSKIEGYLAISIKMAKHVCFDPTIWSLGIIQGYACLYIYRDVQKIASALVEHQFGGGGGVLIYNNTDKGA